MALRYRNGTMWRPPGSQARLLLSGARIPPQSGRGSDPKTAMGETRRDAAGRFEFQAAEVRLMISH